VLDRKVQASRPCTAFTSAFNFTPPEMTISLVQGAPQPTRNTSPVVRNGTVLFTAFALSEIFATVAGTHFTGKYFIAPPILELV
jgi:hypothetical protein